MGLEVGTYISDLVSTNPLGSDAKSTSDDHHRLIKSTIKATFPNITGAMTKTHTELNTVTDRGLIAGQTWTGTHTFPATTYGVTATLGDSSTKFATTAFVAGTAFSSALPAQTGNADKFLTTDGTNASFSANLKAGTIRFVDSTDTTKVLAFSLSGITTGTTRTVTLPDKSGTLAMTSDSALVLLATLTPTAAANVDFLTTFTSTYDNYLIIGAGLLPSASQRLVMRCAVAGAADASALYAHAQDTSSTTTQDTFYYLQTSNTLLAGTGSNFELTMKNVNSTNSAKSMSSHLEGQSVATPEWTFMDRSGVYNSLSVVTGVRFLWESGATFVAQGKIRIYGYQNS